MIVKHSSSKNSNYGSVLEYYTEKHERKEKADGTYYYEPILDENGLRQQRENYTVFAIDANGNDLDPEMWSAECAKTNMRYGKNQSYDDVTMHEIIISHPEEDRQKMSLADLMKEAWDYCKRYLKGFDCLIAIHRDTDNDHIHITHNSVRSKEVEKESWMRDNLSDRSAGGKHHDSAALRLDRAEWAKQYEIDHNLTIENNKDKEIDRKMDKAEYIRKAALDCAARANDAFELKQLLQDEYGVELRVRGEKSITLRHPDAQRGTRLDKLELTVAALAQHFEQAKTLNRLIGAAERGERQKTNTHQHDRELDR